jgi:hypothetical protein
LTASDPSYGHAGGTRALLGWDLSAWRPEAAGCGALLRTVLRVSPASFPHPAHPFGCPCSADERVRYEPLLNIPGTKALIEELKARDANDIATKIYEPDEVSNEAEPLGAHVTTINVDTEALIVWLIERGLLAS